MQRKERERRVAVSRVVRDFMLEVFLLRILSFGLDLNVLSVFKAREAM